MELSTKPREVQNHHLDSTRWNDFRLRPDDIIVGTWAKSGTTWMQQIVAQLIFAGADDIPVGGISPWVELRWYPKDAMNSMLESQLHRRFLKTHLPVDALPFSTSAKYVYIARDGRDCLWSWYNHHTSLTWLAYRFINKTPGLVGPPLQKPNADVVAYFRDWLSKDGFPLWPFWSHVQGWWEARRRPNVLLVHFDNLKRNLPAEIARIARFLDIRIPDEHWATILEHCSFDYMKRTAYALPRGAGLAVTGGAETFFHKGTNGRWHDLLSSEDVERYELAARENLTPACAHWLATGDLTDDET